MPAKKNKDSKRLKQTKLFNSPRLATKRSSRKPSLAISANSSDDGGTHFGRSDSPTIISSDEEDVPSPSKSSRKRRITRLASESPSEEINPSAVISQPDSDVEDLVPKKRRRLQRRQSSEDGAVIADESTDEVDEEDILDSRFRTRNKKSAFQTNLEKLKRRKLKMNTSSEPEDSSEETVDHEGSSSPFKGAKPSSEVKSSEDEGSQSSESSDFIVEDDELFQLPAQFSIESHEDLPHQFKKVFQFFVHIAVQPPKRRSSFMKKKLADEEYFSVPLSIMRRKLYGMRDFLVASSVWKPAFKKKLERYPDFTLIDLHEAVPYCDACHLGGRKSKFKGHLTGPRYDSLGFRPLSSDKDDKVTEYHLGRFCARRTRVYHEFSHWEYELFQSISRELDDLRGSLHGSGFHRIAYSHGIKPPDDLSDADGLCDWLDERRIIEWELKKIEKLMESAHRLEFHSKNGKNGEDD